MKKNYYLPTAILLLFIVGNTALAQDSSFRKGEISISSGLSFGLIGYGWGYGSSGFPVPVTLSASYGISKTLSIGGYGGYLGRSPGPAGNRDKFTAYSFGMQGAFHASPLLNKKFGLCINEEKVDFYAKAILGFETYYWTNNGNRLDSGRYEASEKFHFGPVLGARYMARPGFGVYAEGGRGTFGYLTVGVSSRL